ncbi:iron-containing alcohol dehydrogenase [Paenibacillus sp. D2_2]|uniref:iron-containing alcohol dehydrogenase n=1 Tax=Paenibacillus sp. D2_2 TaxID=3073092 RepID=UPI0028168CDF|nr:iron-containing alcohol dehydrogenase [Paenibacillus sp. D2_2]WMT40313.1 iron-containing alcohol dehydrogenase [Paenibacillus sp. D2_2]
MHPVWREWRLLTPGLGIIHSMSHAFGGTFHIAHGRVNSLLLEAVMEYNANLGGKAIDRVCERYARLASLLHLPGTDRP